MIGPADSLHQPLDILGRADLDHQIHIAPVDPQIERAGANDRAQPARNHRGLHLFALFARQRTVVDADRKPAAVGKPQLVKKYFRLRAGVVENERGAVLFDQLQHFGDGVGRAASRPGGRGLNAQHRDVGIGPRISLDDRAGVGMAGQHAGDGSGVVDGRRQPHPAQPGRELLQACQAQHQLAAAFAFRKRVDFIDHHPLQPREHPPGVLVGQEQRQAFRGGQQDMRRIGALAFLARGGRVAGPVFDAQVQAHVGDRPGQVAGNIRRQRLERRNVESVQARRRFFRQFDQGWQESCKRLATAGRGDQQERRRLRAFEQVKLVRMRLPAASGEPVLEEGRQPGHGPSLAAPAPRVNNQ